MLLQGLQFVDAKISLKGMFDAIAKSDESNNSKITSGIKPRTKLPNSGTLTTLFFYFSPLMNDGTNSGNVGNLSSMPTAAPPSSTGVRKAWHEHVTQDLRNHLVHKL